MVDRQQFVDTLNQKTAIDYVLHDFVCVEHNHTVDELTYLITRLQQFGMMYEFINAVLKWYQHKLNICCVQKPNPNYNSKQTTFINGFLTEPEFITLYYF
jgi:hypothetical protein